MRKFTLLLITLVFSMTMMFASTSYAEWTEVSKSVDGDTYYVDFERIRKHGGYVYWWHLGDYLKPGKYGDLSDKSYNQGDCKLLRYKTLSYSFHKEPMGGGSGEPYTPPEKWDYPPPNSSIEIILKKVCEYAN
ncbi:MAG: hypothetical protein HOC28_00210 [Bacteroidetes Order II. Incertae sedis bacterium]|nr:hypothetical protein [Bacteroidetes Order II. bacterium]